MCKKLDLLTKNKFGEIYYCDDCNLYHTLFNNFHYVLTKEQFSALKRCIAETDVTYWESQFKCTSIRRKIPLPTCLDNLVLIFDKIEFNAIKSLFCSQANSKRMLTVCDIQYNFILN